jgi:hypothetical protein
MMGRLSSRWSRGGDGCATNFVWEKICKENGKLDKSKPDSKNDGREADCSLSKHAPTHVWYELDIMNHDG